jgi:hypothetical protein
MTTDKQLKLSSVGFAVLWTAFMAWQSWPLDWPLLIILAVCGALAGLGWYWLFGKWLRWQLRQRG